MKAYYDMLFKRRSFHLFRGIGTDRITPDELAEIGKVYPSLKTLDPQIRTAIRTVPAEQVRFKRDAEYCILIYSEKKDNYLMNAGYIGEQLDLYLTRMNIGTLWFGIGKPDIPEYDGLSYVIMIAIHKVNDETKFRKDMYKAKRKPLNEIWTGDDPGIAEVSRFAPSACNSQPWSVKNENGVLSVSRYRKPGRIGIMPAASVSYFNRIDIGIFLCFLEICMDYRGIAFKRTLYTDDGADREYTLSARYELTETKQE